MQTPGGSSSREGMARPVAVPFDGSTQFQLPCVRRRLGPAGAAMSCSPSLRRRVLRPRLPHGLRGQAAFMQMSTTEHPPLAFPYRRPRARPLRPGEHGVDGARSHPPPAHAVGTRLGFAGGTTSWVYRETVVDRSPATDPCVLVVEFRLRGVRGRAHALFRAESWLNGPLFAGFPGLLTKWWVAADENGTLPRHLRVRRASGGRPLRPDAVVGARCGQRAWLDPPRRRARGSGGPTSWSTVGTGRWSCGRPRWRRRDHHDRRPRRRGRPDRPRAGAAGGGPRRDRPRRRAAQPTGSGRPARSSCTPAPSRCSARSASPTRCWTAPTPPLGPGCTSAPAPCRSSCRRSTCPTPPSRT